MCDLARLGCPYPRCPSPEAPRLRKVAGRVHECTSCGRLMVACLNRDCLELGTFNRPFVRYCRRCGEELPQEAQAAMWEQARQDGWRLAPVAGSASAPELVAELSRLVDTTAPAQYAVALAMIRGVLAVHLAGHFLALVKAVPTRDAGVLWDVGDPFPPPPHPVKMIAYAPALLPDERNLLYARTQGLLALDLWSCHGLSAKDNAPRTRSIRCARRSIVAPPIPLGNQRIGLLTRGWRRGEELPLRWAVWDLSAPKREDEALSALLDSEDLPAMGCAGKNPICEVVDGRVITISTGREQWVWRLRDADRSDVLAMKKTWPRDGDGRPGATVLDVGEGSMIGTGLPRQSFLVPRARGERFSWFFRVQGDDPTIPEAIEQYDVEFETLDATLAQTVGLPSGASPIGASPDRNDTLQMYFRAGKDIWFHSDGPAASHFHRGLPQAIVDLVADGPLVVSVGEGGREERSIGIHSLHHRGSQIDVPIEGGRRLISTRPLLWSRWLYSVELDADNRLYLFRRTVSYESPRGRK